jgi:hypothetical protein
MDPVKFGGTDKYSELKALLEKLKPGTDGQTTEEGNATGADSLLQSREVLEMLKKLEEEQAAEEDKPDMLNEFNKQLHKAAGFDTPAPKKPHVDGVTGASKKK